MVPVSKDTLLRVIRRRGSPPFVPPTVIGIDDWAWRRNQRYGTLICDLERRRTIALLPDREPATAKEWLSRQPQIAVVARDRGGAYALAAAKALPDATQVADRWHLMENASRAFLDAVRKSMRQIRSVVGAATINPKLLTAAERIQYEGYLRREEDNAAILRLAKDRIAIKEIVNACGTDNCAVADDQSRSAVAVRSAHSSRHRGRRAAPRGSTRDRCRFSSHGAQAMPGRTRPMVGAGAIEPRRVVRQRRAQGQSGCFRRDHVTLVERPDRGANHQAAARETSDVWQREARSPPGARYWCHINSASTKSESEPGFEAT